MSELCAERLAACQRHVNVIFMDVFPSVKLEQSNVFDVFFFKPLRKCFLNEVKNKCQISLSTLHQAHVQFKRFADEDVNVKKFTSFDVAYHTRMIYKPIHIKNMFWIFVLKQIKFTLKIGRLFLGSVYMDEIYTTGIKLSIYLTSCKKLSQAILLICKLKPVHLPFNWDNSE